MLILKEMKTSNKTNSRFLGIAVVMMVLSLVTGNLTAQKSLNYYTLAGLNDFFFTDSKHEILKANIEYNVSYTDRNVESIEPWMVNPAEWKTTEEAFVLEKEINFEENELVLESWMKNPSEWNVESSEILKEEVDFEESEMILEDWMTTPNWSNQSLLEEELEIEDWMNSPQSWTSKK